MRHGSALILVLILLVPLVAQAQQVASFDVEAATDTYLSQLSSEERERSDAYFEGGYWLQLWGFLYGLGMAWLLLSCRWSAGMRDLAERVTRKVPLQTALYALQYLVLTFALGFPLTVYQAYYREHHYGLATQSFGPWFGEQMTALAVALVLGTVMLMVLYGVFRRSPRRWWVWGAMVSFVFLLLILLIAPVFIAPLFNTYEPVDDPAVRDPILAMARANGVPADNVYQFDASRQSTRISANVSGIAGTLRVSLNDNLLNRTSPAEIQAVMGHELGHYVLNHVYEGLLFFALVLFGGFAFLSWSFDRALARWGGAWKVGGIGDVAGLPLLTALLSVYLFALTPVLNTFVRTNEAEADIFGLNAAREPDGFAEIALKLSEYRKLDPGLLEEFVFFDHPSGRARIYMSMRWKAEHLDELAAPANAQER